MGFSVDIYVAFTLHIVKLIHFVKDNTVFVGKRMDDSWDMRFLRGRDKDDCLANRQIRLKGKLDLLPDPGIEGV